MMGMGEIKTQDDFLRQMIKHHEAALPMAKAVLTLRPDDDVAKLANGIIEKQTAEIQQMKAMLARGPVKSTAARILERRSK